MRVRQAMMLDKQSEYEVRARVSLYGYESDPKASNRLGVTTMRIFFFASNGMNFLIHNNDYNYTLDTSERLVFLFDLIFC